MTKTETIIALLAEQIDMYMQHDQPIVSEVHGTRATIAVLRTSDRGIALELDDGSDFSITVERY